MSAPVDRGGEAQSFPVAGVHETRSNGAAEKPAGAPCGAAPAAAPEDEATAAGFQMLIGGVTPISQRARLQVRADAPLEPKRAQKRCDHGLFDEASRIRTDLVDLLRLLERGERV